MISKISFLQKGEKRVFVTPNPAGYFKVPGDSIPLTANQFVRHHAVVDNDPTLTLEDGKKYRVFHASNSTIPLVYPSIVLDNYDKKLEEKEEMNKRLKEKLKSVSKASTTTGNPLIPPFTLGNKSGVKTTTSGLGNLNLPFGTGTVDADPEEEDDFIYFDDDDPDDGLDGW